MKGWFWPQNSQKAHYYQGANTASLRSLCGKWALFPYSSAPALEDEGHSSPDNCAKCQREHAKLYPTGTA